MTSKDFKAILESLGWGIAHARRLPRSAELRAYVAVRNGARPEVDEIRYTPGRDYFTLYQHATRANGYGQYDRYLGDLPVPENF